MNNQINELLVLCKDRYTKLNPIHKWEKIKEEIRGVVINFACNQSTQRKIRITNGIIN